MIYVDGTLIDRLVREVATLRSEQAAQFGALRADLARLRARPAAPEQAERIEALHAALGLREFTGPEVLTAVLANTPAGAGLAEHFSGCSIRQVGVRLGRLVGRTTPAGLLLERVDVVGDLSVWRVTESPSTARAG